MDEIKQLTRPSSFVKNNDFSIKVVVLIPATLIGGAERSVLKLIRFSNSEKFCYKIIFHNDRGNPPMEKELEALGTDFFKTASARQLFKILKKEQPDILYMFGQVRTLLWIGLAKWAGTKILLGAERGSGTRWINRLGRSLDHRFLDAIITNSQKTASVLQENCGVPPAKLFPIYNGIHFEKKYFQLDAPKTELVCVANIRPIKGQIYLLRAVKNLRSKFPKLKAVLLGKDLSDGEFFEQVKAEQLEDTYEAKGFVTNVYEHFKNNQIFVLPSTVREGVPSSIMEAMTAGIPVIASDVGSVSEIVVNRETGILIPPKNEAALSSAIEEMITNVNLRKQLTRNALHHIKDNFSIEKFIENHEQVFENFIQEKK